MNAVIWIGAKAKTGFAALSDTTAGFVVIALTLVMVLAIAV